MLANGQAQLLETNVMKGSRVFFALRSLQLLLATVTLLAGCGEMKNENTASAYDQISASEWEAVTAKRTFFGHQSVGENILSGVRTLASGSHANLAVKELATATTGAGIVHFRIGTNEDPHSKIREFERIMRGAAANGADVALMKFCYLDIVGNTDVKSLAEAYISSIDNLARRFPKTTFVAVTVPLTTVQGGVKALVKRAIGRIPSGYVENVRRQQFNRIIREKYANQNLLFDLAKFESEGSTHFQYQGSTFETLNPVLTSDGGHLNSRGELLVATKLLIFIANLPAQPRK